MKSQVIPAQITTVEDRIAGSLSLSQVMLLLSPAFFASIVFALLPEPMHLNSYKTILSLGFGVIAVALAVRVKEKLIVQWLAALVRFNLRPKFYVYNKNDQLMRRIEVTKHKAKSTRAKAPRQKVARAMIPETPALVKLEEILNSGQSQLRFRPRRKGGLHVALEKVQQKS